MVDPEIKRSIILKPGGSGFFGGTIIRSLITCDGNKLMRKFGKKKKRSLKKSSQKTKKPFKKSKQVSKKSKKSKKTTKKTTKKRK